MPAKPDVDGVAVADRLLDVRCAVAVGIAQAPEVRGYGQVDVVLEGQHTARDVRHLVMEVFNEERGLICHAVAIGVFDAEDLFFLYREVAPVMRAVAVEIGQVLVLLAAFGSELLMQKSAPVLHRLQRVGPRHPVPMSPDVELGVLLPDGPRDVSAALVVDGKRDGVRRKFINGPEREVEAIGDLDPGLLPDRVGLLSGHLRINPRDLNTILRHHRALGLRRLRRHTARYDEQPPS